MTYLLYANAGEVFSYIGYILLAILVLLVMITVHELGHYITGKIFKFGINEFAIGFGPAIFKKNLKSGEKFSLRIFPLGGFCAFKGEDEEMDAPDAFNKQKPWKRFLVLISGALMNYLLAFLIIAISFGVYGQAHLTTHFVEGPTSEYTAEYSFSTDDVILEVEGKDVYMVTGLIKELDGKKQGDKVDFVILTKVNGEYQKVEKQIVLRKNADFKNIEQVDLLYEVLGITPNGLYSVGIKMGFFKTIGRAFMHSIEIAGTIFMVLGQLLTGKLGLGAMGGTVTTITATADVIKQGGLYSLLQMGSFIGVNLAVFNLLPIPALDGSRAVFTVIEGIRKKPLNRKVENIIHTVGLVLLLAFAILLDLQQCF
ncbi:MAG: site-2 protease family protein [Clostridia bacterium]|nr:site-2 protease family protein [Clostridia bacterium]